MTTRPKPVLAPRKDRALRVLEEERQHWEPKEVASFYKALDGDDFWEPYFRIGYYWGCRVSEPALIFAEEIQDGRFVLRRLKRRERELKSGRVLNAGGVSEHSYAIPDAMKPYFDRIFQWRKDNHREDSAWLFPSKRRRQWNPSPKERMGALRRNADNLHDAAVSRNTAHVRFKKAVEAADIPQAKHLRKTHVLRHTRATLMFAEGASVDQVQHYLSHSDPKTTQIYLHEADALRARLQHGEIASLGLEGF